MHVCMCVRACVGGCVGRCVRAWVRGWMGAWVGVGGGRGPGGGGSQSPLVWAWGGCLVMSHPKADVQGAKTPNLNHVVNKMIVWRMLLSIDESSDLFSLFPH